MKSKCKKLFAEMKPEFMTKKDWQCLGVLLLVFTCLVFFRLGSFKAPQTTYTTKTGEADIVLDFGEYTDIASFSIFLGNLNTRHLSLSAFNEVTGEWEIINGDATVCLLYTSR